MKSTNTNKIAEAIASVVNKSKKGVALNEDQDLKTDYESAAVAFDVLIESRDAFFEAINTFRTDFFEPEETGFDELMDHIITVFEDISGELSEYDDEPW